MYMSRKKNLRKLSIGPGAHVGLRSVSWDLQEVHVGLVVLHMIWDVIFVLLQNVRVRLKNMCL